MECIFCKTFFEAVKIKEKRGDRWIYYIHCPQAKKRVEGSEESCHQFKIHRYFHCPIWQNRVAVAVCVARQKKTDKVYYLPCKKCQLGKEIDRYVTNVFKHKQLIKRIPMKGKQLIKRNISTKIKQLIKRVAR